ncbi:MAG TPA: hypothetical protein DCE41_02985, partial [Cytophagales bacterium]|nr:hypothetical protein [Cytophagales bacterium]
VYDDRGRLRYVLQPEFTNQLQSAGIDLGSSVVEISGTNLSITNTSLGTTYLIDETGSLTLSTGFHFTFSGQNEFHAWAGKTTDFIQSYSFQYEYDGRNRMIAKRMPGADWTYMVYDQWDRLVLTQDGRQRSQNTNLYAFTKYDALNRPVLTGEVTLTDPLSVLRTHAMGATGHHEVFDDNQIHDYSLAATYPTVAAADVLTATYYDHYEFDFADSNDGNFSSGFSSNPRVSARGLTTGSKVKVLDGGNTYLSSSIYYDEVGNVVQTHTQNHRSGLDVTKMLYAFTGELVRSQWTHTGSDVPNGASSLKVEEAFHYDHTGRLLSVTHKIFEGSTEKSNVRLSEQEYNELGQLTTKHLHETAAVGTFVQDVDFGYHIQGFLKKINGGSLTGNDKFAMELHYETGATNNSFAGDIGAIEWQHAGEDKLRYEYTYDDLHRMTEAAHTNLTSTAKSGEQTVNGITYDLNGNLESLRRKNNGITGYMDDLAYRYVGNQLAAVQDAGEATQGFIDGANTSSEYGYDLGGNLVRDDNKGITHIDYNAVGLPSKIEKGSDYIEIIYDAAGVKLYRRVVESGSQTRRTDYLG